MKQQGGNFIHRMNVRSSQQPRLHPRLVVVEVNRYDAKEGTSVQKLPSMTPAPNTSVSIEVMEAIRGKKQLYCQAVDTKTWADFERIALPDATMVYKHADGRIVTNVLEGQDSSQPYKFDSRDDVVAFFKTLLGPLQTVHLVDSGSFERISDDEVRAVFVMIAHSGLSTESKYGHSISGGQYHDVYKMVNGEWFLKSLEYVMSYQRL
ncbi:hypothetical protein MCOR14_005562 [Pyricularia oryzae]|nr:hypothetical protein MCOR14_005562 [Pyricularia oryzae]